MDNFFASTTSCVAEEVCTVLHAEGGLRIEKIESFGHASPPGFWYDQPNDEWVLLARGHAVISYEDGRRVELSAGDSLELPRHQKHRVEMASQDALWLAVHWSGSSTNLTMKTSER